MDQKNIFATEIFQLLLYFFLKSGRERKCTEANAYKIHKTLVAQSLSNSFEYKKKQERKSVGKVFEFFQNLSEFSNRAL